MLAPLVRQPWHLYATLGVLVGSGANCLGYTGQSLFLPNWFVHRRGLAMSMAFSGVGVGSILVLPWLQGLIGRAGWRTACWALGISVLALLAPLNLLLKRRPEDLGLAPDGDRPLRTSAAADPTANVVDAAWVAVDWTSGRAMRTARFWWIAVGYLCGLFAWYAVQIHQTKYLVETGVSSTHAAWALGFVSLAGIPGQIALGHVSDRIGREWVWTIGSLGFGLCFLALLGLYHGPTPMLLSLMVVSQGMLGYGLTSVIGVIPAEIFQSPHYGTIFGTLMLAAIGSGAARAVGNRRAARRHRELHTGLLDRHWVQCAVGRGNLVRGAAQGAGRCRPHPSESSSAAWGLGESSAHSTSCRPQLCQKGEDAQNLRAVPHHLTIAHLPPA